MDNGFEGHRIKEKLNFYFMASSLAQLLNLVTDIDAWLSV
jgi:hypothetical protein